MVTLPPRRGPNPLLVLALLMAVGTPSSTTAQVDPIRMHEVTRAELSNYGLNPGQSGLVVDAAPGRGHGLLVGDVIVAVGNERVVSLAQLNKAIVAARQRGGALQLTIVRKGLIQPLAARLEQPVLGREEPVLIDLSSTGRDNLYERLIQIVFSELASRAASGAIIGGPGLAEVIDEDVDRLRTGTLEDKWEAAEDLAGLAAVSQRAVDVLLGLLRGSDGYLKSAAAVALVDALDIDDGRVAPLVLVAGLDASLRAVKQRAAQRLGRLRQFDPDIVAAVRKALTRAAADPEPAVATTARNSLGRVPAGARTGTTTKPVPQPSQLPQPSGTTSPPPAGTTPPAPATPTSPPTKPAVPAGMTSGTASIVCAPPIQNRPSPVRFTLAAPSTVSIWPNSQVRPTWWISSGWNNADVVANVVQGVPVLMPSGSDPRKGLVALSAGTYILYADCPASGFGTAQVRVTYPGLAEPAGQRYTVVATATSDRAYLLAEPQTVRFRQVPTSGAIWTFTSSPGTILWSADKGRLETWSTLDHLPGGYCLHGEKPIAAGGLPPSSPSVPEGPIPGSSQLNTMLEIYGPSRPPGRVTTLTAVADGNAYINGVETGQGVQFRLAAPQLVTVRARTGWIIDADGNLWFNIVRGEVQSGSSWVEPAVGRKSGEVSLGPGVLLPSGTYHFAVSSDSGARATGQIDFVGTELKEFPWPAQQRSLCFPDHTVNIPHPARPLPPPPNPPKPVEPVTAKVPGPVVPPTPPLDPGAQYSLWAYGATTESDGRQCVRFPSSSGRGTPTRLEQVKQQLNERASQRCASGDKAACAGYSYVLVPAGEAPPPRDVCTKVKVWWSFEGLFGWGGGRTMYDFRASAFQSQMRSDLQNRCSANPKGQACRQGATLTFQVTAEDAPRPAGCPVPPCR